MPRRLVGRSTVVLSALLTLGSVLAAQGSRHIDTEVALSHAVRKVQPEMPAEAIKAKVGGSVVADVTIGVRGTVDEVTILSGDRLLHAAAERALRQWTFKPFLTNGKPRVVQVILTVNFPDLAREEEERATDEYQAAYNECSRRLRLQAPDAEEACAAAVLKADALPRYRLTERSETLGAHAASLAMAGRTREAIAEFERVCQMQAPKAPDPVSAEAHLMRGLLHQQLGEYANADAELAAAVATYSAVMDQLPALSFQYEPRLRNALLRLAALKRATGDPAGAAALETRAAPPGTSPVPKMPVRRTRTIGEIRITEPESVSLTDEQIRQIRETLAPGGKAPWRLDVTTTMVPSEDRTVTAFLAPDVVTATFRSGRIVQVWNGAAPGQPAKRAWQDVKGGPAHYLQVAATGADPAAEQPIRIIGDVSQGLPSDNDLVAIVQSIRDRTVAVSSAQMASGIRSWPVTEVMLLEGGELNILLSNPAVALGRPAPDGFAQSIRMRKVDGRWTVTRVS